MLEAIEKIRIYSNGFLSAEDLFLADDQLQYNAICHLLLAIGEESRKVDDNLKETQSFIAWDQIAGMRNRIAHDYRGIDKEVVFSVVKNELSTLANACGALVRQLNLSRAEISAIASNPFFKHAKDFLKEL